MSDRSIKVRLWFFMHKNRKSVIKYPHTCDTAIRWKFHGIGVWKVSQKLNILSQNCNTSFEKSQQLKNTRIYLCQSQQYKAKSIYNVFHSMKELYLTHLRNFTFNYIDKFLSLQGECLLECILMMTLFITSPILVRHYVKYIFKEAHCCLFLQRDSPYVLHWE